MRERPNSIGAIFAVIWLLIVLVPIYVMLRAAFMSRDAYGHAGPIGLPSELTFENFQYAIDHGFGAFMWNSAVLTLGTVGLVLLFVPPLAFAIARGRSRMTRAAFLVMLFGIAIPAQVVVIPLNYLITRAGLYDTLIGVILPTAAFAMPLTALILASSMRDIGNDLYEAMAIDGAGSARIFWTLVLPLTRGGLATIVIVAALQAWNSYLIPLTLTRSADLRVATLGLGIFKQEYSLNVPGLMAAVVLTVLPILVVYLIARRALIRGFVGLGGK